MKKEKSVEDIIAEFSKIALDLSLGYVKVLAEGKTDLEAFKHLNEVKKHLNFAKKLRKEMSPKAKEVPMYNSAGYNPETVKQIKKLQNTVGEIVRSMPKS